MPVIRVVQPRSSSRSSGSVANLLFLNPHLVNDAHERRFLRFKQFDTTADELIRLGWIAH